MKLLISLRLAVSLNAITALTFSKMFLRNPEESYNNGLVLLEEALGPVMVQMACL
ncbi:MAG: hypothetical protein VYE27_04450 [Pseudomonadota bacterium]|nr:hypothetical protein [Pseudomonadota bacterium]